MYVVQLFLDIFRGFNVFDFWFLFPACRFLFVVFLVVVF